MFDTLRYMIENAISDTIEHQKDVVETIFSDPEYEGKKNGYAAASKEYSKVLESITATFRKTEELFSQQRSSQNELYKKSIRILQDLEEQKEELERQLDRSVKKVSIRYDVPATTVKEAMGRGSVLNFENYAGTIAIELFYQHKKRKYRKAEKQGYEEAKREYAKKVRALQNKLSMLIRENKKHEQELEENIKGIFDDIVAVQTEIAELNILL